MNTIKTLQAGKYTAIVYERMHKANYPNHTHAVQYKMETPKARVLKDKMINHFVYKSEQEAIDAATKWITNIQSNLDARDKRKEEIKAANAEVKASDFYKVGDVIVNSWGYEQTNIDFYQVVKVGNKTIETKAIYSKNVEGTEYSHGMACEVVAAIDSFKEDGEEHSFRVKAKGALSQPVSYGYFRKWDGAALYESWYA